jgi:undecaprenyl-diphosphatase
MPLTAIQAVVLGIIQGLAEFLPISSSGHLVLGEAALGLQGSDITFEVIVHFGTLLAVLTALRQRVFALASGAIRRDPDAWRMIGLLALGSIPAAVVGLLFEDYFEAAFSSPAATSGWLLVTGAVLWSTRHRTGSRTEIGVSDALLIGLAQAFAVLPGISRSGTTISTGLWRGLDGREAATFSFLLSIPVILGATVLKVGTFLSRSPGWDAILPLLVGMVVAYVAGVFAIRWLMAVLRTGRMDRFAYYCWAIGLVGLSLFWR